VIYSAITIIQNHELKLNTHSGDDGSDDIK